MFDLRKFRKDQKITQLELVKLLGVSGPYISQVESRNKQLPERHMKKLIEVYGKELIEEYINENPERMIDRFDKYMKKAGKNDNMVTKELNLSNGRLGKARKPGSDLSRKMVALILSEYVDLNPEYLKEGNGPMLIEDYEKISKKIKELEETIQQKQDIINILLKNIKEKDVN